MSQNLNMPVVTLHDLTPDHLPELTAIVTHPEFFYPYINQNNQDAGMMAAGFCQYNEHAKNNPDNNTWIKAVFNENKEMVGVAILTEAKPIDPETPKQGKTAEIGYFIKREEWGKGYGSSAAHTIMKWGYNEHHISHLRATVDPEFEASIHIIKSLGLKQTDYIEVSAYMDRQGNPRPRLKFEGTVVQ